MTLHKVDLWTKFSVVTMQMKFLHRNLPVAQFVFLNNIFENGSDIFNNFFFYSCERVNGVFNYVGRLLSRSG